MKRRNALLAIASVLAGCGGGGDAGGSTSVAEAAPLQQACTSPKPVAIQLFGDSTMWGYNGVTRDKTRAAIYPELALQQIMDSTFGAGAVTVSTRAVNGTRSTDLLQGTDGVNQPWPGSVAADVVVLNFGINEKSSGMSAQTYMANLRALATAPARVVFQTPLPTWVPRDAPTPSTSFAPEMRDVAAQLEITVADAGAYALGIASWNSATYAPDGIHPNASTYQGLMRDVLALTLVPIVRELRCAR